MADSEIDITALRLKLEQGKALTSYEVELLLGLLSACETRSRGRKVDPNLPILHETIAILFELYKASGMTPKAARDETAERCGVSRSQIYTVCKRQPLKKLSIVTELAPILPCLIHVLAADVKSTYPVLVWDFAHSVLLAVALLTLLDRTGLCPNNSWNSLDAGSPNNSTN